MYPRRPINTRFIIIRVHSYIYVSKFDFHLICVNLLYFFNNLDLQYDCTDPKQWLKNVWKKPTDEDDDDYCEERDLSELEQDSSDNFLMAVTNLHE